MSWAETAVTSRAGKSEQGWCREALRVIEEKGQQILVGKTCLFIKSTICSWGKEGAWSGEKAIT